MRNIVILSILALAPAVASADAIVKIHSDQPANAYLDGKLAGSTPLAISRMRVGNHTVKVENAQTGEVKIFNVHSPAGVTAEKDIDVAWDGGQQPVVTPLPQSTEVVHTTIVQEPGVVVAPAPVVVAPVRYASRPYYGPHRGYGYYESQRYQEERDKVRSRNTLLGAAAANEIFNTGNSKGLVRGVTLGGALLNEVLRSGK